MLCPSPHHERINIANLLLATLKNDDPDESDEEGEDDGALAEQRERTMLARESANTRKSASTEKQPTGRVVGVIKRNWRAYVA